MEIIIVEIGDCVRIKNNTKIPVWFSNVINLDSRDHQVINIFRTPINNIEVMVFLKSGLITNLFFNEDELEKV